MCRPALGSPGEWGSAGTAAAAIAHRPGRPTKMRPCPALPRWRPPPSRRDHEALSVVFAEALAAGVGLRTSGIARDHGFFAEVAPAALEERKP
jgi:hypothetical protein